MVVPASDLVGFRAREHFDDVIHSRAEPACLTDSIDAGEELLRQRRAVVGRARFEAVVARAAVAHGEVLAEIGKQFAPAAR